MLRRLVGVVFCTTIWVVFIRLPSNLLHENFFLAENLRACGCLDTATISNRSLQPTSPMRTHIVGAFGLKGIIDDESLVVTCVKEQRETSGLRVCRRFATKKIGFCAGSCGGDGATFEPWFWGRTVQKEVQSDLRLLRKWQWWASAHLLWWGQKLWPWGNLCKFAEDDVCAVVSSSERGVADDALGAYGIFLNRIPWFSKVTS